MVEELASHLDVNKNMNNQVLYVTLLAKMAFKGVDLCAGKTVHLERQIAAMPCVSQLLLSVSNLY
jgi:hypothetical protein